MREQGYHTHLHPRKSDRSSVNSCTRCHAWGVTQRVYHSRSTARSRGARESRKASLTPQTQALQASRQSFARCYHTYHQTCSSCKSDIFTSRVDGTMFQSLPLCSSGRTISTSLSCRPIRQVRTARSQHIRSFQGDETRPTQAAAPEQPQIKRQKQAVNRGLVQAIRQQVQKETVPWLQDMLQPWLDGRPEPLIDTVPPEQLADADSRFVVVDGVQLHYKEAGRSTLGRPTVILLHGLNGSTFSWRGVLQPLADHGDGCRVIAFDRPPYGLSERPLSWSDGPEGNPYTSEAGARYTQGLMKALGVDQAILVGHSAGALTAMELFKRDPKLVGGLVFVAPALPSTSSQPASSNNSQKQNLQKSKDSFIWRASLGQQLQRLYMRAVLQNEDAGVNYIRKSLRKRRDEIALGKLQVYADSDQAVKQTVIEGYLRPMLAHNWDKGSLYSYRAFSFPSGMPYEAITQPVLFITGEKDQPLTNGAKKVVEILKQNGQCDVQYKEYPAGHVPMDEMPDRFLADLQQFVTEVGSAKQPKPAQGSLSDGVDNGPLPLYPPSETAPVQQ